MVIVALSFAGLALSLTAPFPPAEQQQAVVARPSPLDAGAVWSAAQGGASATDSQRGWDLAVSERGLRVLPLEGSTGAEEQAWSFEIGTASFGRMGAAQAVTLGQPAVRGERVDLDHGSLSEWFVRGEHGVEHGWTIPSAPEGNAVQPLWIGLRVEGDLSMHIVDDGSGAFLRDARGALRLRYIDLKTFDASGLALPSKLMASPFGVGIQIEAEGAAFPITVDPVVVTPAWEFETDQTDAGLGRLAGQCAGNVNGDRFGDVLVAIPGWDGPAGIDEGQVRVFLGSASGPMTAPVWTANGGSPGGSFGETARSAGDLNGDGYDDIAVIASGHGNGKLYVWMGGQIGPGNPTGLGPDGTPANADFTYESSEAGAFIEARLCPGGDLDHDGYDDLVLGAIRMNSGPFTDAGTVMVFFGGPAGIVLGASNPWSASPAQLSFAVLGVSVAAGDLDADGSPDLSVGASGFHLAGSIDDGRVYVFRGGPTFRTQTTPDFFLDPPVAQTNQAFGYLTFLGDVNGDGFGDLFVAAPGHANGQTDEGRGWVYHGTTGGLIATPVTSLESNLTAGRLGISSGTVGDIDGDGYADLLTSCIAPSASVGAALSFGGTNGIPNGLSSGMQYLGESQAGSSEGRVVDGAGDVNDDGFMDVVTTAPSYGSGQVREGRIRVHFGSPNPEGGFTGGLGWPLVEPGPLQLGASSSRTGRSVSSAGDVNADGFNDVVVGSPEFGATDNGRVQVILGGPDGLNFASPQNWTIDSPNAGERFGWSVSAGDIDNDGKSDIVVGAPRYSSGQTDEGRVYVFKSTGVPINSFTPTWSYESNQSGALLGSAVSALGDVNADGFNDIAAGAPGATSGQGSVTIFHGRGTGLALITPAITITSGIPGSEFGTALALVGDVNLDGFGDLAVGAPKIDNPQVDEGRLYVYLGSYTGISNTVAGQEESQQAGAQLGSSIAQCGDINGDGRAEILVGAPGYDAATSGGAAFLYRAQPAGAGVTLTALAVRTGAQANSQYGLAVSAGGDVNGDGWSDVLVGAPDFDGNLSNQGRIYLYLGSSTGLAASSSETYDGPLANARFGESIALGGDVNGDGLSDPIGGVPSANNDTGGVIPLTGGGVTSWRVSTSQRQSVDQQALQILGRTNELNQFQINLGLQNGAGNTATAMGRAPVKLEWENQPVGTTLNGSGIQAQVSFVDSGALGAGLRLSRTVTGLLDGTAYHWRARTVVRNPYYPHTRWTTIQLDGLQEKKLGMSADCNNNGIGDTIDLALATSLDCNADTIPDECQVPPLGSTFADCNANLVPDPCEYSPLFDCDSNGILDECQIPPFGSQDCNANSIVDTCDIASSFSLDTNGDTFPDECQLAVMAGATFCFGDGTGTACPCGNSSPVGNQEGCLNSLGTAGRLRATGIARVQAPFDNFTLIGTGMPNSSALYFQGTTQQSSGNGAVFGDGKRCAAGSVVRLATKINSAGASQYPVVGDLPISVKGLLPAGGGTRTYQVWYRNAAAFCTASTFNLSNGFRVTWIP